MQQMLTCVGASLSWSPLQQQRLHVVQRYAMLMLVHWMPFCRSEEVCQAQADLAAASATVQQLHSDAKRVISSRRLQLPPANTAAGTGTDGLLVSASILSDGDAGDAAESQQGHGSGRGSAIIGRVAPEDSWQDMPASECCARACSCCAKTSLWLAGRSFCKHDAQICSY